MPLTNYVGGRLFADRYGSANPRVVALHGWGRDRRDFVRVLDGLDAISVDLPGFGASPPPREVMGAGGYADLIAALVDELGGPRVLAGHSFGGRVATVLAAERPELVSGLVLVGVPLLRPVGRPAGKPSAAYRLVRWGNRIGLISDVWLEREKRRRGSADYRAASGVMRDILVKVVHETYEDELTRVACPVRMVWGKDDREVPLEVAYRSAGLLDNVKVDNVKVDDLEVDDLEVDDLEVDDLEVDGVTVDVVEGCGHDVPRVAPDRIRLAIEALL